MFNALNYAILRSQLQQIATVGGQDLVDAAVAARDAAQAQAVLAQGYAAQLAAGIASPVGPPYANISALNTANPDHTKIYVTLDDGKWCYHNGSAFVAGGVYQAVLTARPIPAITANVTIESFSDGIGIDWADGTLVSSNGASTSEIIPCDGYLSLIISGRSEVGGDGLVYYDVSGNKILPSGMASYKAPSQNGTFTIPSGAVSFQITLYTADKPAFEVRLGVDDLETTQRVTHINGIPIDFPRIDVLEEVDLRSALSGHGIDYGSGNIVTDYPTISTTAVTLCAGYPSITVTGRTGNLGLVFYNSIGGKIKPIGEANYNTTELNGTFEVPSGAVSFQLAFVTTSISTIRIVIGLPTTVVNTKVVGINGVHLDGLTRSDFPLNPADYCSIGDGTSAAPFQSTDGTAGFASCVSSLNVESGKIRVPSKAFSISEPITLNVHALCVEGDAWNYSTPPNGVFPSNYGSRICLESVNDVGFILGESGIRIAHVGVQGTVVDGNTQGLFSLADASKHCAVLGAAYSDQTEIKRLNCVGLSSGISIPGTAEIDACLFDWINADGCNVGIFFAPANSYYTKIINCLLADCPAQGIWVKKGSTSNITYLTLDGLTLVRNCGGITAEQLEEGEAASALLEDVSKLIIRNCQIRQTGVWVEFFSSGNGTQTVHNVVAVGLILDGLDCDVTNNQVIDATGKSAVFRGSGHMITGNRFQAADHVLIESDSTTFGENSVVSSTTYSIKITGDYNIIRNCTINKPILVDAGATGNILIGFDLEDIVDNGTNTVIK